MHISQQSLAYRALEERTGINYMGLQRALKAETEMMVSELDAVADALGLVGWQVLREAEEPAHNVVEFLAPSVSSIAAHEEPLRWREQTDQ